MKISEIIPLINGKLVCGEDQKGNKLEYAFASDLMSDVLRVEKPNLLLITGLVNIQAIRTAELSDISYIVFARNKKVSPEMTKLASENNMVLIESPYSMFRISGMLFQAGIIPVF